MGIEITPFNTSYEETVLPTESSDTPTVGSSQTSQTGSSTGDFRMMEKPRVATESEDKEDSSDILNGMVTSIVSGEADDSEIAEFVEKFSELTMEENGKFWAELNKESMRIMMEELIKYFESLLGGLGISASDLKGMSMQQIMQLMNLLMKRAGKKASPEDKKKMQEMLGL